MMILSTASTFFLLMIYEFCLVSSEPNVHYQIHSNNDLRELPQTLLKGARAFKFDPFYVELHDICIDENKGNNNETDCFILSHDTPQSNYMEYSTSTELILFLRSAEFALYSNSSFVTIALCFKAAPDKCQMESSKFKRWITLVDRLYDAFYAANVSNVEIILDGDGKPIDCLVGRWQPWNSVWINTPADAFYSNSQENDYYRFRTLNDNENVANWKWMASTDVNYGKFSSIDTPYQLWEPDAQEDIIDYINIYRSGAEHPAGFHFTINSDIAMFQVYSSSDSNNTGLDVPVAMNRPLGSGVSPCVVQLSPTLYLILFQVEANLMYRAVLADEGLYGVVLPIAEAAPLPSSMSSWLLGANKESKLIQAVNLFADEDYAQVLLVASSGALLVVNVYFDPKSSDSTIIPIDDDASHFWEGEFKYESTSSALKLLDASLGSTSTTSTSSIATGVNVIILIEVDNTLLACIANLSSTVNDNQSILQVETVSSMDLQMPADDVDSARVAALSSVQDDDCCNFLIFASSSNLVLVRELTLSGDSLGKIVFMKTGTASAWISVTVGQRIAVSYSPLSNVLMLVNDGGYCYNSHTHNTRAIPSVCSSFPTSTEYILDYTVGFINDWLNAIRDSQCVVTTLATDNLRTLPPGIDEMCFLATPCHQRLLHGTYDQGSKPTIVLSRMSSPNVSNSFFIELHEGYNLRFKHGAGCGEPIHRDGIVLDSFDIRSWVQALQFAV